MAQCFPQRWRISGLRLVSALHGMMEIRCGARVVSSHGQSA
jgi:hypothetical protein